MVDRRENVGALAERLGVRLDPSPKLPLETCVELWDRLERLSRCLFRYLDDPERASDLSVRIAERAARWLGDDWTRSDGQELVYALRIEWTALSPELVLDERGTFHGWNPPTRIGDLLAVIRDQRRALRDDSYDAHRDRDHIDDRPVDELDPEDLPQPEPNPRAVERLRLHLDALPRQQQLAVQARYFYEGAEPPTLREVSQLMGSNTSGTRPGYAPRALDLACGKLRRALVEQYAPGESLDDPVPAPLRSSCEGSIGSAKGRPAAPRLRMDDPPPEEHAPVSIRHVKPTADGPVPVEQRERNRVSARGREQSMKWWASNDSSSPGPSPRPRETDEDRPRRLLGNRQAVGDAPAPDAARIGQQCGEEPPMWNHLANPPRTSGERWLVVVARTGDRVLERPALDRLMREAPNASDRGAGVTGASPAYRRVWEALLEGPP